MRGRPKLVWVVTVRANDASGCHIYGVYKTEPIAKAARAHVEAQMGTMNRWPLEKIKGEHWISLEPYPLSEKPTLASTVGQRMGSHRTHRVVEITP